MSLFWDKLIKGNIKNYGFREKSYRGLSLFFQFFRIINKLQFFSHKMMQQSRFWGTIKTARELVILKKKGLLPKYNEFLKQHNAYPSGGASQNFYYFQFIKNRFERRENLNFLEIGAGGGYLLYFV